MEDLTMPFLEAESLSLTRRCHPPSGVHCAREQGR